MEIIFLGTSGCIPTEDRNLPALAVEWLNEPYLFDCGEGTQRQMRLAGVNFMRINHIFLTHLHADHFMGLGGLIQSMDFQDRRQDLNIHGPPGTRNTVNHLLDAGTFKLDNFQIHVNEVQHGLVQEGVKHTVTCTRTPHTRNSLAYCFEEKPHRKFLKQKALQLGVPEGRLFSRLQRGQAVKLGDKTITSDMVLSEPLPGRKIVYSGDTSYNPDLIGFAENADILVHEATFSVEEQEKLVDSKHSTTQQAAEIARKAGAQKLFLTHISQRYTEPEVLEKEAQKIFPNTQTAADLLRVKVEKHW
ncbi:MAG: ribonuclease Z [Candidatus Altiarchaeales archaeon]|nr:ribonuclease Z [Candidatus Altiarchaeales archaeon]